MPNVEQRNSQTVPVLQLKRVMV